MEILGQKLAALKFLIVTPSHLRKMRRCHGFNPHKKALDTSLTVDAEKRRNDGIHLDSLNKLRSLPSKTVKILCKCMLGV